MKHVMKFMLSAALLTTQTAFAAGGNDEATKTADAVFKLTKDIHKVSELIKKLDGKISKESLDFAKEKLKDAGDAKMEVRKISSKRLQITVQKTSVPIEFMGLADGSSTSFQFLINGQEVEISTEATPQENYDAVLKAMPKKTASIFSLLLPQAEAQDFMSMIVPLVTVGASLYMFSSIMSQMNQQPQYAPMGYPCYSVNGILTCGPQPQMAYGAPPPASYYPQMYNGSGALAYPYYGSQPMQAPTILRPMSVQSVPTFDLGHAATFVAH